LAPAACRPNWSATSLGSRADAYATLIPSVDGADDAVALDADAELDELESDPPHAVNPTTAAAAATAAMLLYMLFSLL
jgi:hypothetical protein